jgi:hypothetical protein
MVLLLGQYVVVRHYPNYNQIAWSCYILSADVEETSENANCGSVQKHF